MHDKANPIDQALRFSVAGIPRPKGSHTVRPNGTISESELVMDWCALIKRAAVKALGLRTLRGQDPWPGGGIGAAHVCVLFTKPAGPSMHGEPYLETPDLDKTERAILDSISAGTRWGAPVLQDDRRVCRLIGEKVYGPKAGAYIWVGLPDWNMQAAAEPRLWPLIENCAPPGIWPLGPRTDMPHPAMLPGRCHHRSRRTRGGPVTCGNCGEPVTWPLISRAANLPGGGHLATLEELQWTTGKGEDE